MHTSIPFRLSKALFFLILIFAGAAPTLGQSMRKTLPIRVQHLEVGTTSVMPFGSRQQLLTLRSKEEKVRQFGGAIRYFTRSSVQLAGQKAISLADDERFYGKARTDAFWTRQVIKTDSGSYTALRTYQIRNNKLVIEKEARLGGFEFGLQSIDRTGNWVYSDCNEGDCSEVTLLNGDLQEIRKYAPWPEGFQECGTFINEGRVAVLLHPHGTDQPFRLAVLNGNTGDILFERDLPRQGHSASGLFANEHYGLVVTWTADMSEAETLCFNANTGATVWTKPGNLLNNFTVTDAQQLLVHDYEDLRSYDLATGDLRWQTHIMDFHKTTRPDFNGVPFKVVSGANGETYLLVKDFPTLDVPETVQEQAKLTQHTTLYELTEKGTLVRQELLGRLGLEMRLSAVNGELVVRDKQLAPAKRVDILQNTQARVAATLPTWPVNLPIGATQGRVTGTPGEFRENLNETTGTRIKWRLHLGIDVGPNKEIDDFFVIAVKPGKLEYFINNNKSVDGIRIGNNAFDESRYYQIEPFSSYLKVGGLFYYHTAPGIIDDVVNRKTKISRLWTSGDSVVQGDILGDMYTVGIDAHVHMQDNDRDGGVIENYLIKGYGVSGWSYLDKSVPIVNSGGITFHKGERKITVIEGGVVVQYPVLDPTLTSQGDHDFFATNDKFDQQKPLVKFGSSATIPVIFQKVDIVSDAYDAKNTYDGTTDNENPGRVAPFKIGYEISNYITNEKLTNSLITFSGKSSWPTIDFSVIKRDNLSSVSTEAIAARIHADGSTVKAPKWIVTNRYENGTFLEDAWDTRKIQDGVYEVKVIAEDAPPVIPRPSQNRGEGKTIVYVDNNRAYIQKVYVTGVGSEGQYSAEWVSRPDDSGQIDFKLNRASALNLKTNYSLKVTASEPMKTLTLLFNNKTISGSTTNNLDFTFAITTPENPAGPETLKFEGTSAVGEKLAALTKGETTKNVGKRSLLPSFKEGNDTRHELSFCISTNPALALGVKEQGNGTSVLLESQNGVGPFEYAQDEGPFSSGKLFENLQANTTYTFKVRDKNGCQASNTIKLGGKGTCNEFINGFQAPGVQPFRHELGTNAGLVVISYEMYTNPDKMEVRYNGSVVQSTTTLVSGQGTLRFNYDPVRNSDSFCTIEMTAPNPGTGWYYTINCPVPRTTPLRVATTPDVQPQLTYQAGETSATVQVGPPVGTSLDKSGKTETYYVVRFRYLGDSLWTELRNQLLPIMLNALEKEREVEIRIQEQDDNAMPGIFPIKVVPNPNDGRFVLEFNNLAPEPDKAMLEVVDIRGTVLLQQTWEVVPGVNKLPLQIGPPTTGIVVVRLKLNKKIWVTSFLLVR